MNNVQLLGRTTNAIELKTTQSGKTVANFTLAVNRNYDREKTDFINCIVWNKTAEIMASYVAKGQLIAIDGEIQTRAFEDKNGNKRTATEVVVSNFYFAESKKADPNIEYSKVDTSDFEEVEAEDLPF